MSKLVTGEFGRKPRDDVVDMDGVFDESLGGGVPFFAKIFRRVVFIHPRHQIGEPAQWHTRPDSVNVTAIGTAQLVGLIGFYLRVPAGLSNHDLVMINVGRHVHFCRHHAGIVNGKVDELPIACAIA